ncbi:response regulator transcription factor [Neobacillus dielmonensis]|uniref:response regulator transcription factor n=1 Tax=Neobacillus dielmonensis TaxID=1347369 RepID=UPI0005A95470|nr:response regulator transcription factor [Neobacillus dielmonensis]
MSKSLNHHLNQLLEDAIKLLSRYNHELLEEWNFTLQSLKNTNKKSIYVYEFISGFLQKFLTAVRNEQANLYRMFDEISNAWFESFQREPDPEALIFHLNLLENSAHRVVKAQISYSSKLHPSIHYLFSKISEVMLFRTNQDNYSVWKDAVILFNEWIIRSQTFQEAVENICYGFGYFLPFKRCALFRFTNEESMAMGQCGHHFNNEEIQAIAEKITNIPVLNESLVKLKSQGMQMKNFQPIYVPFAENEFPEKYVKSFKLTSLIIVPIYVPEEGKIIGGVILDQGPETYFTLDRSLFPALIKFGQSSGELLLKYFQADTQKSDTTEDKPVYLTPREIEIIKLLAEGASTQMAAAKLYLSEYTVRDHISNIMKRLNAQNRTEVAVKAIRMGIID